MTERRGGWQSAKQALESYKACHRRQAPPGCQCPFCLNSEQLQARLEANQARLRAQRGRPPF